MEGEIHVHLASSIRTLVEVLLLEKNDTTNVDDKAYYIIKNNLPALSIHASISLVNFCPIYAKANEIDTFPPAASTAIVANNVGQALAP